METPWRQEILPPAERFRVIYCATQRAAAFGETVAQFRESLSLLALLEDVEDHQPILADNPPGVIPSHWRSQRRLGVTVLDSSLRFVDVGAAQTLSHLRIVLAKQARDLGERDIDLGVLTGSQRLLTQEAARYIYSCRDVNATPLYAGVRYVSRLNSSWECFAVFADRMVHTPNPQVSIFPNDPGLVEAAAVLGLTPPEPF